MGLGLDVSPITAMMGQNDPSHLLRVIVVLPVLHSLFLFPALVAEETGLHSQDLGWRLALRFVFLRDTILDVEAGRAPSR
jgi:hypothetical protein